MSAFDSIREILLVEDDPRDAELIACTLSHYDMAHSLYRVKDGQEALDYIFARGLYAYRNSAPSPRFILLDLKLPKISGLHVLKQLKSTESTRHIPVIVLTSSQEESDRFASYDYGATSYMIKPIDGDQFEKAVCDIGFYWMAFNSAAF